MDKLFNTPFEAGIRSLLLLSVISPESATIDRIAAYDFISIYGKNFGITEFNLHGNNAFNFSEFPAKRKLITEGVKEEVLDGMISVSRTRSGFKYRISEIGKTYADSLDTDYSRQYSGAVRNVNENYGRLTDQALMDLINAKALKTVRR